MFSGVTELLAMEVTAPASVQPIATFLLPLLSSSAAPHQATAEGEIPDQEITGCASCKANPMPTQRALTGL